MRKTILLALAIGLVAAACSSDPAASTTTSTTTVQSGSSSGGITAIAERFDPNDIQFVAALDRFDACDDVLDHFKAEALARVGPYGLDGRGPIFPFAVEETAGFDLASSDGEATTTVPAGGDDRGDGGFSGTNTQVAGVDEPDIVKTDGDRIIAAVDGRLQLLTVDGAELTDSLALDGWDHRLFLSGDRLLVFSRGDLYATPLDVSADAILPAYGGPVTLIHEVDLSGGELDLVATLRVEGSYLSARSVDGIARVVVSAFPADLPFVYPSSPAAEDLALETNRRVIQESTLETWLPSYTLLDADGDVVDEGLVVACDQVHRPAEFAGFDTLAVLTLDLQATLTAGDATAVIARGETVYASTESLYVATNVWVPAELVGDRSLEPLDEDYSTAIHQFDISQREVRYVASGSVDGHLLNQFAMDEYDGRLRIATTDGAPWTFREDSESRITILQPRDGELVEVGSVGDMGRGERIFSVRFIGETAYVVTFRQVDPLYVVDLRDPESPEVTGELKIAGYSAYLHPVGDGLILGIGQDATDEGVTTGAKATLFDVSDPTDPRAISSWTAADAYTDVEWDHLAFLHWAPTSTAILPLQDWRDGFHGAVVLKTDDGVREVGRISHAPIEGSEQSDCEIVTASDFGLPDSEIDPSITVLHCGEEDLGGLPSHDCEIVPAEELFAIAEEEGADFSSVDESDRFEICFPGFDGQSPILRSLVIGDTVWTLSWQSLQANDLATLDVVTQVPLR